MDINIAEQKVFLIPENLSSEQARERAWDKKIGVFASGLASILSRPKGEDIRITYQEKRYEPFWFIHCSAHYIYDRLRKFPVAVSGQEVREVTVSNLNFTVTDDKKYGKVFFLPGTEHCQEDSERQAFFDGLTGERKDYSYALKYRLEEILELEKFNPEGILVPPEIRASFVVRQMLTEMLKPVQADAVFEEKVRIEKIELYYRPLYAFEYLWATKDRQGVAEFDGLTGEMRTGGKTLKQSIGGALRRDMLFDLGADVLGLLVPGGSIAVKLAKTALDMTSKEKKP